MSSKFCCLKKIKLCGSRFPWDSITIFKVLHTEFSRFIKEKGCNFGHWPATVGMPIFARFSALIAGSTQSTVRGQNYVSINPRFLRKGRKGIRDQINFWLLESKSAHFPGFNDHPTHKSHRLFLKPALRYRIWVN